MHAARRLAGDETRLSVRTVELVAPDSRRLYGSGLGPIRPTDPIRCSAGAVIRIQRLIAVIVLWLCGHDVRSPVRASR
jgi:hypothetical protein